MPKKIVDYLLLTTKHFLPVFHELTHCKL